jgi:hypothetical protein
VSTGVEKAHIAELAEKHAPLVVLHREDKLRPAGADWFIARSSLRWATGRSLDGDQVSDDRVDGSRLGAGSANPYSHGDHLASALTRPLDDNAARHGDAPLEQGFFLRLGADADARGSEGTSSDPSVYAGPGCYWDYDEAAKALTYWLFYAGSTPPLGILRAGEQIGLKGAPVPGVPEAEAVPRALEAAEAAAQLEEFEHAYPGLALEVQPELQTRGLGDALARLQVVAEGIRAFLRADDVLHEGDWERITLYLDEDEPLGAAPRSVVFYQHSTNAFRTWASVEKDGDRPVVYSAIGSHASLPSPGFGHIDVGDPHGLRWRTWEALDAIVDQPWYGFGGAWGRVGKVRDSTGPLGPGAHWKHAAPRPNVDAESGGS